jgi:hypothetical protein
MAKKQPPRPKKLKDLEADVQALLEQDLPDEALREQLEALASEEAFNGIIYLWGPELYRRNRVLFRPFILNHFSPAFMVGFGGGPGRWKDHAKALNPWLDEVDRRDDVELFHRLYPWKHPANTWGGLDEKQWRRDLVFRFEQAEERYQRNQVLNKFDIRGVSLDEKAALTLYRTDPAAARPFILKHLSGGRAGWGVKAELPEKLFAAAEEQGDEELYFSLYRRMVPHKRWMKDLETLAEEVREPQQLIAELEKRHPTVSWDFDVSAGFYLLAKERGRDVVPYLMKHLDAVWAFGYYGQKKQNKLLEHARKNAWWDVWSVLVRKGEIDEYNKEVLALVEDRKQPDELIFRRLVMLSGAAGEWNWGRFAWQQIPALKDRTALALYRRFPELVRGPFRKHLLTGWWGEASVPHLAADVLKNDDQVLCDYLAGKALLNDRYAGYRQKTDKLPEVLRKYYDKLRDKPAAFARRVASVLGQLPANSIGGSYKELLANSELARLFFVGSVAALQADPRSVRDLLEAPEIHAQMLAFRVLAGEEEPARQLAAENLDLLLPTLLRPLHRKSRLVALRALANAATNPENARRILGKARQALDMPDQPYPKEHLLGLIAQLYHRWPELRGAREQLLVYPGRKKERAWL